MKTAKLIVILILTLVVGIVILQNRGPVQTRLLFISVEMPQILLLFLTAVGGFFLGILVSLLTHSKTTSKADRPFENHP